MTAFYVKNTEKHQKNPLANIILTKNYEQIATNDNIFCQKTDTKYKKKLLATLFLTKTTRKCQWMTVFSVKNTEKYQKNLLANMIFISKLRQLRANSNEWQYFLSENRQKYKKKLLATSFLTKTTRKCQWMTVFSI